MVGMEQEDTIHGASYGGRHLCWFTGIAEHHVQEVSRVIEAVIRVHEGLPDGELVTHGSNSGHLGNQSECRYLTVPWVGDVR